MSIIKVPIGLSDPDGLVPLVADYAVALPAIASMLSWHSARRKYATIDDLGKVSSLVDRSGHGVLLTQTVQAKRPVYLDAQLGGFGALSFGSAVLNWGGTMPTAKWSKVIAFKTPATIPAIQIIFGNAVTGNKHSIYLDTSGTPFRMEVNNGTSLLLTKTIVLSDWHVAIQTFDGSTGTMKMSLDGVVTSTTNAAVTSVAANAVFLGAGTDAALPGNPFTGEVADAMVFNDDLFATARAADLALIKAYMLAVYGKTA